MNQPDSPLETEAVRAHGRTHRMACKLLLPALIGLLLTSAGCQRATDRDEAALTAPNPDLNFRILYTEPCTGCREFHEPGNSTTFYGLPRRDIRAEDIVGLRRYDEQHDKGIELRFAPNADAKIRNLGLEHISHQMAVMIGDQPVRISMIRGVFSDAVVFTGYTLPEREVLFQRMTSVPAKDAKSATAK